jgi:hypothetical protein
MMRFADIAIVFHSLVGLCSGWILGGAHHVAAGLLLAVAGAVAGLGAGFLIARVPRALSLVRANIPRRHRVFATVFAACGVGVGVVFWSACLHCAGL